MLLIYSKKTTPRLKYIFKHIFQDILSIDIDFTSSIDSFINHQGAKISYGKKPLGNELFFQSHDILFDTGVSDIDIRVSKWGDIPIFFPVGAKSSMPFDIFGASFYLLSRYEEYLPHIKDKHGRFYSKNSLAVTNGFNKIPLVDIWTITLYRILDDKFDFKEKLTQEFRFETIISVSMAYKYRLKNLFRTSLGFIYDIITFDFHEVYTRLAVYLGFAKDPFDSFNFINVLRHKYNMKMNFFFLLSDYSKYDRNISYNNVFFKSLIKDISDQSGVGLEVSYYSNYEPNKLKLEKERMESTINFRINRTRQHFTKIQFPETYRHLIDNDICNDYSMGYTDTIGYRASTSETFYFYDLDFEIQTPLKIHPFVINDYAMRKEMGLSTKEALEEIKEMISLSKSIRGNFTCLFHNNSLGSEKKWYGWRNVYAEMIKYIYN